MQFPSEEQLKKLPALKRRFYQRAKELQTQGFPPECYDIKARLQKIRLANPVTIVKGSNDD